MEPVPYLESHEGGNSFLRTFSESTSEDELKWHWDAEDRVVSPQHPTDWMLQLDNQIPKPITESVTIPAGEWHRLIKGTGSLTVKVEKDL